VERIPIKPLLSSDCGLQLARMKAESLVTAGQQYGGEYVPGLVTASEAGRAQAENLEGSTFANGSFANDVYGQFAPVKVLWKEAP